MSCPPIIIIKPLTILKPWAGTKLNKILKKQIPDGTGETWEFAKECNIENTEDIKYYFNGIYDINLENIFQTYGKEWYGTDQIKIMIKFIDSSDFLSLQVHPNDKEAQLYENYPNGKSEAWFFIDTDENSEVINGITLKDNLNIIKTTDNLNIIKNNYSKVSVNSNTTMMIPAGLLHAIGKGILLYEIQQYSNITYRLYDWHRTDRELHLDKGLKVLKNGISSINTTLENPIIKNQYFETNLYDVKSLFQIETGNCYKVLTIIEGNIVNIKSEDKIYVLKLGQTACLPKNQKYWIKSCCRFLLSMPLQ